MSPIFFTQKVLDKYYNLYYIILVISLKIELIMVINIPIIEQK